MNPALFRPGTSDRAIWHDVVELDEYRLPQMTENDLCLDVGANTGAATYAMLQKGAGKVIAFEPDPDNYILFRKQLKQELKDGRVEVFPIAVVGGSGFSWRMLSGPLNDNGEINYGGSFLLSEDYGNFGPTGDIIRNPVMVPCIGIEGIRLPEGMNRRLLKLDCEGSEFEILGSTEFIAAFQDILGEYHPFDKNSPESMDVDLKRAGHVAVFEQHPNSKLGHFFSTRR